MAQEEVSLHGNTLKTTLGSEEERVWPNRYLGRMARETSEFIDHRAEARLQALRVSPMLATYFTGPCKLWVSTLPFAPPLPLLSPRLPVPLSLSFPLLSGLYFVSRNFRRF